MSTIKSRLRAAVIVAAVGVGTAVAVAPADAHTGSWKRERSGCLYTGGVNSLDSYAYTKWHYGSCAGHAWLRVQFSNGTWSLDEHAAGAVEIYGPIRHAYHKSQSGEGWGQSH